jgi:hypothetical protein
LGSTQQARTFGVEGTMSSPFDHLSQVIRDAEAPGDVAEPVALLGAIAAVDNPLRALSDLDQANNLFSAFYGEFGFIRPGMAPNNSLQSSEQSRWSSLFRWFVRELNMWRRSEDPASRKLTAIFVVAQANDRTNEFWDAMPEEIAHNSDLIEGLKGVIRSFAITFSARGGLAEPIWEREAIDKFQNADAQGDWATIGNSLRLFERQIFSNILLSQSVRCLYRCGMGHLVDALANMRQTLAAMEVARALPTGRRLRLAVASDNPYVQFGCAHQTISARHPAQQLSPEEQQLMEELLLKVAIDASRWAAWMQVFNAYPTRYPALQAPLGRALALVSDAAVGAYVNAIILMAMPAGTNTGRRNVAECLRAFRAKAAQDRRLSLWRAAHARWSSWNFDQANPNTHLFAVNISELDYALVAFACECLSDTDRATAMTAILEELQALDLRWYTSIADIITAWNRLLSQFQPYAYASRVISTDEDWLYETTICLPFDPATNEYINMKYKLADLTPTM